MRVVATLLVAAAVLASAAAGLTIPDGAYCQGTMMALSANGYLAFIPAYDASSNFGAIYRATTDIYNPSNLTLNQVQDLRADSVSYSLNLNWATFDGTTITIAYTQYRSQYYRGVAKLVYGACPAQTSSYMTPGTYCSPTHKWVASSNIYLFSETASAGNGWTDCASFGKYYLSSGSMSLGSVWSNNCTVKLDDNALVNGMYNPSRNTISARVSTVIPSISAQTTQIATMMSMDLCGSQIQTIPVVDKPYCIGTNTQSQYYRNAVFVARSDNTYSLTAYFSGQSGFNFGYFTCNRVGFWSALGNIVELVSPSVFDMCLNSYSNLNRFYTAQYFSSNDSYVFTDSQSYTSVATPCTMDRTTELAAGSYVSGNAYVSSTMIVTNDTFLIRPNPVTAPTCLISGRYIAGAGGYYMTQAVDGKLCAPYTSVNALTVMNNVAYFTFTRSTSSSSGNPEGWAFVRNTAADVTGAPMTMPPAGAITNGRWTATVGGADVLLIIENGGFYMLMNNSWIGANRPCMYTGWVWLAGDNVNFNLVHATCKGTAATPVFNVAAMTYTAGLLRFAVINATANMWVDLMPLATGTLSTEFCAPGLQVWQTGNWFVSNGTDPVTGQICLMAGTLWANETSGLYQFGIQINDCTTVVQRLQIIEGGMYAWTRSLNGGNGNDAGGALMTSWCNAATMPPSSTTTAGVDSYCGNLPNLMGDINIWSNGNGYYGYVLNIPSIGQCAVAGTTMLQGSYLSYNVIGFSASCNSVHFTYMMIDTATGALTITANLGTKWDTITLTRNSCTQASIPSGNFCPDVNGFPRSAVTVSGMYASHLYTPAGAEPLYLVFPFYMNGTNVTRNTTAGTWTGAALRMQLTGFTGNFPNDWFANYLGTEGMTISSFPGSLALTNGACSGSITSASVPPRAMSAAIPELGGGMVTAYFLPNWQYVMWFPGGTNRCFASGMYATNGNLLSLSITARNTMWCGANFEFSQGWIDTAGNVNFKLWVNQSIDVVLMQSNCNGGDALPAGQYCDRFMSSYSVCKNSYLAMNNGVPTYTGVLTANANGTISAWSWNSNTPYSQFSWNLLRYTPSTGLIWTTNYRSTFVMTASAAQCGMTTPTVAIPTGTYCGISGYDNSSITFHANAWGTFSLRFLPPGSTGSSTYSDSDFCAITGYATWIAGTSIIEWNTPTISTAINSNCYFNSGSNAAPYVAIDQVWFDSATYTISMSGNYWTSDQPSTATWFSNNLTAFGCRWKGNQTLAQQTSSPFLPQGQFGSNLAWYSLYSSMLVSGNEYFLTVARGGSLFMMSGYITSFPGLYVVFGQATVGGLVSTNLTLAWTPATVLRYDGSLVDPITAGLRELVLPMAWWGTPYANKMAISGNGGSSTGTTGAPDNNGGTTGAASTGAPGTGGPGTPGTNAPIYVFTAIFKAGAAKSVDQIKTLISEAAGIPTSDFTVSLRTLEGGSIEATIVPVGGSTAGLTAQKLENIPTSKWQDMGFTGKPLASTIEGTTMPPAEEESSKTGIIVGVIIAVIVVAAIIGFFVFRARSASRVAEPTNMGGDSYQAMTAV